MKLKLIEKRLEAEGTKSFIFESDKQFDFLPGQYIYLTLPKLNYPDPRGTTRHFTIASSPTELPNICVTTRIRAESGFKKTLDELVIGENIEAEAPFGEFTLNENDLSPQVFLAGGIGITPFRSMLKYIFDKKLEIPIILIYSNPTPAQITFRKELETWAKENENYKLYLTISQPQESKQKWSGLTGRIKAKMIQSLVVKDYLLTANFWVCGPPPMVSAIEEELDKLKIKRVISEKFTGY